MKDITQTKAHKNHGAGKAYDIPYVEKTQEVSNDKK